MTKDLQQAFRFFHANIGGVVGRIAIDAIALARAEQWARDNDLEFQWEYEDDADLSWCDRCEHIKECSTQYRSWFGCDHYRSHEHEVLWVRVELDGEQVSLGGIVDADRDYRRIIEAQLAEELHDGLMGLRRMYRECWAD